MENQWPKLGLPQDVQRLQKTFAKDKPEAKFYWLLDPQCRDRVYQEYQNKGAITSNSSNQLTFFFDEQAAPAAHVTTEALSVCEITVMGQEQ